MNQNFKKDRILNRSLDIKKRGMTQDRIQEYNFGRDNSSKRKKMNDNTPSSSDRTNSRKILNMMLKKMMKKRIGESNRLRGSRSTKNRQTPKYRPGSRGFFKNPYTSATVDKRHTSKNKKSNSLMMESPGGFEPKDFKIRDYSYDQRNSGKSRTGKYKDNLFALYKNKQLKLHNVKLKNRHGLYSDQRET